MTEPTPLGRRWSGVHGWAVPVAVAVAAVALVTGTTACADKEAPHRAASPTSTITTPPPAAPPEYAQHLDDWVLPGHDYDNSRSLRSGSISAETVDHLSVAWSAEVAGGLSTVPLIVGSSVYVQDSTGHIASFDRATGAVRWTTPEYGVSIGPYGVAVGDGRVYAMLGATGVVAVDQRDGHELWRRQIIATPSTGVDIQPTVIGDLVLVSTVPVSIGGIYKGGDRGVIQALDAATGTVRWTFDTVASPDLWGHPDINSGGGAWYPPAIDPSRSLVYWGVANPAPFPGTPEFPNGSSRPGDNLYTDSVVALDVGTGTLEWYHQVVAHDLFDRDLVHTMIARPGKKGAVVIGTGKGGRVVGLDPDTGSLLWETAVGEHLNDELESLSGPTKILPGTYGGVLTPPATADGTVYVGAVNAAVELRPDATSYFGAELGQKDGTIVAIDATTGRVSWTTDVPGDPLGGVTVVNDLVLTALLDGTVLALDRSSGEIVWHTLAPGGINGWMSAAGDLLVVPVGNADPPRLVAYRID